MRAPPSGLTEAQAAEALEVGRFLLQGLDERTGRRLLGSGEPGLELAVLLAQNLHRPILLLQQGVQSEHLFPQPDQTRDLALVRLEALLLPAFHFLFHGGQGFWAVPLRTAREGRVVAVKRGQVAEQAAIVCCFVGFPGMAPSYSVVFAQNARRRRNVGGDNRKQ